MDKENKNNTKIQEYGAEFPPMMDKKTAASFLRISIPALTNMENGGLVLCDFVPGFALPKYFKAKLNNIHALHTEWRKNNKDAYADLQR